jgi:RNA polymerase sigma factor (sigma-70 family)
MIDRFLDYMIGSSMLEDKLLVWRFNHGSRKALRRIYENYKDDLLSLAATILNDESSAEDVVHDIFVSFTRSAGTFRLKGSLKGYLATCVANRARNIIRTRHRQRGVGLDEAELIKSNSNRPVRTLIIREQAQRLNDCLGQLPYEQREVIILHLQYDIRFGEIARSQNISINTVQSRYRYGLENLTGLRPGL